MAAVIAVTLFSCIPARQVEELQSKYDKCDTERSAIMSEKRDLETENTELQSNVDRMTKDMSVLTKDTTVLGTSIRKMTKQYDKINRLNDELLEKMALLQKGSNAENRKLLENLQIAQEDLQRREDELKDAQRELNEKQMALQKAQLDLEKTELVLQEREKRVNELEKIIAEKDAAVKALKDKIAAALLGFKDKGLTVEQRNGKIYISMEAKLLFPKGSTTVDPEGQKALVELAKVLQDQKELEILVEGHTDTDKLSGNGPIKDNWQLSVMRATAVVKIMLSNSTIDATQITAAGRGEHLPVDSADTEEAKAKNRRIEVILTPNLDELFEIIDSGGATTE
ncbi:MAG: OmpA family protein [Flavobacteriales bacterium]|nr:OmpA family protein [Flavobacteriales bacterium]